MDGETSLKTKHAARATSGINLLHPEDSESDPKAQPHPEPNGRNGLLAGVECENPNPKLDNFWK